MELSTLQNNLPSYGRLVVSSGAVDSISRVSDVFFKTCTKNFREKLSTEFSYSPWMSALSLVNNLNNKIPNNKIITPTHCLDFSEKYLSNLEGFLRLIPEKKFFNDEIGLRVFCDVLEKEPEMYRIFEASLAMVDFWESWQKSIFHMIPPYS